MIQVFQDKSPALSCSDNTVTMTALKLYPKLIQPTSHRHILFTCSVGGGTQSVVTATSKGTIVTAPYDNSLCSTGEKIIGKNQTEAP
jgi:hypothetical protein